MTLRRRLSRAVGRDEGALAAPALARMGGTTGKMKRAKPPNVIGRGPLLGSRGFGVAIVCIVKDEVAYLEEWIAYHVALGVDHFLIYDNRSSDGSAELLERYQNHGLVTRIDWPLAGGQLAAYNHALRFFGGTADWLAYYDVDEFLVPLLDDDIPTFLARFADAAVVRVPRLEFGYSGHRTPPAGLTIDVYSQVANVLDLDPDLPPRVKSIVRPGAVSAVDIHLAFPADVPSPGAPTETVEEVVRGVAQLNHYYTRSFEEFEAKRFRGSATGLIDRPAVPFAVPTLATDTAARRFSERTLASLERLRSLEPRPYAYGSELRMGWFPRPNDLGRFAEFAVAGVAAGLPEPGRSAALRLKNLYDGVGLVADLSGTGYAPVREGLSGSVHVGVLVEHMRGRLETSLAGAAEGLAVSTPAGPLTVPAEGPARLAPVAGSAELRVDLPASQARRCWSLGFLLGCEAPLRLVVSADGGDGPPGPPLSMDLPASACLAGIVEVEASPGRARGLRLIVETEAPVVDLFDLFAISTG